MLLLTADFISFDTPGALFDSLKCATTSSCSNKEVTIQSWEEMLLAGGNSALRRSESLYRECPNMCISSQTIKSMQLVPSIISSSGPLVEQFKSLHEKLLIWKFLVHQIFILPNNTWPMLD